MNINEIHKVASKIQIKLFKKSNSHTTGSLRSSFRGSGLQFKEHRIYEPGDEIRFIDWKASAKRSEALVKTFEEERNLRIVFIIDFSPSMLMGANGVTKIQAAIEICALFILVSQQSNDFIIPVIVADDVYQMEKCKGQSGLVKFLKQLEYLGLISENGMIKNSYYKDHSYQKNNYNKVITNLKGKREVVLITDFLDGFNIDFVKILKKIKSVHCFHMQLNIDNSNHGLMSLMSNSLNRSGYNVIKSTSDKNKELLKSVIKIDMEGQYLDQVARSLSH